MAAAKIIDPKQTMELVDHSNYHNHQEGGGEASNAAPFISTEPTLILNPNPTQPKPAQVTQIADQYQENFANYNWMSPRIIEN